MKKIRLGSTGLMVTQLGFGGIPIQRVSEEEAVAVVNRCLELGINYIDTARNYTTSEGRIGKAIAGRREEVILATKTQSRTREGVEKELQQSLGLLGVDYVDLYQFHNVSTPDVLKKVLAPDGPLAVAGEAKKAGVIRHLGATSHQIDIARELVESGHFETIMFPFNFIAFEAVDELMDMARERDMGFISMKPLAGGMVDSATVAIKFLLQFPDILVIPGIEHVHEIEEIVGIVEGEQAMTEAEKREMERMRQEMGNKFCRRCDYCQPCTEEINISTIMHIPSFAKRMAPEGFYSGFIEKEIDKAAACNLCGHCEERCPYGLPIRDMIGAYVDWYRVEKKKYSEQAVF